MKSKRINLSFNQWAIISILMASLPILVAQYYLNYSFFKNIQHAHSTQRLDDLKNKAEALLLFPVASSDKDAIEKIVNDLMKDDELKAIHLKDSQGETILYREGENFLNDKNINIIRKETKLIDERPVIAESLVDSNTIETMIYGSVILYITPNKNDALVSEQLQNRSIIFAIIVIIIIGLVYLMAREGHKHALRIVSHIQDILTGLNIQETKYSPVAELNQISNGLNLLSETLNQKITDLEHSKKAALDSMSAMHKAANFKDEFIHIVSHEIRTPVNTITNLINILESHLEHSNLDDIGMKHYTICKDASHDLRHLVDELVNFDKLERSDVELLIAPCELTLLFNSIEQQNRTKFETKSLAFSVENVSTDNISIKDHILIDTVKLKQIITNLLDNALKYTKNGAVSLKWMLLEDDNSSLILRIICKDSGIGIPDESVENIFEPFYQVQKKRVYAYSGYGLGLSIVKKITEAMQGNIDVTTKVDIGTTFTVSIPVQPARKLIEISPVIQKKTESKKSNYNIDAAVIDDDSNNGYTLAAMLDELGITSRQYTDPQHAIDELIKHPADTIFIDLHMVGLDGFQVAKQLRNEIKANPTLICVTADTHKSVNDLISTSAMDGLIYKPIDIDELIKLINAAENAKEIANNISF